jgi:hypothetical protein
MNHPAANDLALLAGGDAGPFRRFFLDRHARGCADCQGKIAEFQHQREEISIFHDELELPDLNWNSLAAEMRANIRLGLEAGACVRSAHLSNGWNPRLTLAFASLLLLVASSFFLRDGRPHPAVVEAAGPVLQSSGSGIEFRTGHHSLTLLNRRGVAADQTVSAQGRIGARYIDGETGAVTINNVYLQ